MKTINFILIRRHDLVKADQGWDVFSSERIFIQCDKHGNHKPLSKINRVWTPFDILCRIYSGKPTKLFGLPKKLIKF